MSRIDDIKFNLNANVYANDGDGIAHEDVTYLLAENERLVKALEHIAEREYYDEKYPMKVALEALRKASS